MRTPPAAATVHLALVALLLNLIGCSGGAADTGPWGETDEAPWEEPPPPVTVGQQQPPPPVRGRPPKAQPAQGGIVQQFIRRALLAPALTDSQREQIDDLRFALAPTEVERAASQAFVQALADGVAVGVIDVDRVHSSAQTLGARKADQRARQADVLAGLHRLLTSAQREDVVRQLSVTTAPKSDADEDAETAAVDGRAPLGDEQGPAGRSAGPLPTDQPGSDVADRTPRWGRIGKMLERLQLTARQKQRLASAQEHVKLDLPSPAEQEAWRENRRAATARLLQSFSASRFDAADYFLGPFEQRRARDLENELRMLEAALPILDEPQRAALADMLLR